MQTEIPIRNARLEDSVDIAAILRALGWSEHLQKETPAQTQAHVAERLARCQSEGTHTVLVAERRYGNNSGNEHVKRVVGYISVHWFPNLMRGYDGYVSELFVSPEETGHGIGSRLLEAVRAHAVERDCTRLLLMNRRIRESYKRHFYEKCGWQELPDAAFFSLTMPVNSEAS